MKYLLDTDHLSILQRKTGDAYHNLSLRISQYLPSDFAVSTVTFHEQMLGLHAFMNRKNDVNSLVKGYSMMTRMINDFRDLPLLPFDADAAYVYEQIAPQQIQLAKMDARIAAITLSRELILLTRNSQDFSKVSSLTIEDWTIYQ